MLPRDSQFSTTPFVFPLFTLGLSHALSPPFIPFATFRPPPSAAPRDDGDSGGALFLPSDPRTCSSGVCGRGGLHPQRVRASRRMLTERLSSSDARIDA